MLGNVDRVYNSNIVSVKRLQNLNLVPRTLSRCVCPLKNEQQQKKPVIDGVRNKKEKRSKKFRIKSEEKKSVISRIEWYS